MTQSFAVAPAAGYCARCHQGYAIGPHVCPDLEESIRAAERAKCAAELAHIAEEHVERWAPIVGEDRAKACALDILSAARKLSNG